MIEANWKPRIATVDSWLDLVGSRQHGVTSNKGISWSADHLLNADGDDLTEMKLKSKFWMQNGLNAFKCRLNAMELILLRVYLWLGFQPTKLSPVGEGGIIFFF